MLSLITLIACELSPEPAQSVVRWPLAGESAWVEVRATVDEQGRGSRWSARAGVQTPPARPDGPGCHVVAATPRPIDPWLARVRIDVPARAELIPAEDGLLLVEGPLSPSAAEWDVGDVALLRTDASTLRLNAALRFGQAVEITSVQTDLDGNTVVAWAEADGQSVEILTETRGGEMAICSGENGETRLPWWAVAEEGAIVTVRSIRHTRAAVKNEGAYDIRGVIEQALELAPGQVSERNLRRPPNTPAAWEPKKILRYRSNFG